MGKAARQKKRNDQEQSPSDLPWCRCCRATKVADNGTRLATPAQRSTGEPVSWRFASGTRLQSNHGSLRTKKLADFLVRAERATRLDAVAVECKSRIQHVDAIIAQLENGLALVQDEQGATLGAVIVHSGPVGQQELKKLMQRKVRVAGRLIPVKLLRSGSHLTETLS